MFLIGCYQLSTAFEMAFHMSKPILKYQYLYNKMRFVDLLDKSNSQMLNNISRQISMSIFSFRFQHQKTIYPNFRIKKALFCSLFHSLKNQAESGIWKSMQSGIWKHRILDLGIMESWNLCIINTRLLFFWFVDSS